MATHYLEMRRMGAEIKEDVENMSHMSKFLRKQRSTLQLIFLTNPDNGWIIHSSNRNSLNNAASG